MEIHMTLNATFDNSMGDQFRRAGPELVTGKNIRTILEREADGKPLILIIAKLREDGRPGRYTLHKVKKVLAYQSAVFLEIEEKRLKEEEKVRVQTVRQAKLNEIKTGLRKEKLADDRDFDERYGRQTREQAEIVEAGIEEEAVMIFEAEEKQSNK